MSALNIVIVGAGSVGKALGEYLHTAPNLAISYHDPPLNQIAEIAAADVIHVTVPYKSENQYMEMWHDLERQIIHSPLIILNSTLNPLILRQFQELKYEVYYSPTRGPENTMVENIRNRMYFYAPLTSRDTLRMQGYLQKINLDGIEFRDPFALAYGKLMETTNFGMQIAFAQMMQRICKEHGWNFDEAYSQYQSYSEFQRDYRTKEVRDVVPRPIFFPGKIGGKCVMQNLQIVDENNLADMNFVEFIMDSNDKVAEHEK